METSAACMLTVVCFLLAAFGCQSMQLSSVETVRRSLQALRMPRGEDGDSTKDMDDSRKADNSSTGAVMDVGLANVTVPHFLRELYLHLDEPASHLYSDVNSILSYENEAINGTQCDWMKFDLPEYDSETQYVKSELKIFHRVSEKRLAEMSGRQRRHRFKTYLCYRYKRWCIPITRNTTVTPSTDGLVTYTFNPVQILKKLKLKTLYIRIRVVGSKRLVPCGHWLLNFVTDDCLGKDKVPLMVTYMKKPETSILSMFFNEAVKNAPIPAPSIQVPQAQLAGHKPRHKRETTFTPITTSTPNTTTPAPTTPTPTPPCKKQSLPIQAGWSLTKRHTFTNTFDIGFCGGHCSEVYVSKGDERTAFINLARRKGYIFPDQYPESCVPDQKANLSVIIMPRERVYDLITLHQLVVKSCMCVV